MIADLSTLGPDDVEVRLVVGGAQLSIVGAMAVDIALRNDFDLDTVSDLRLAVAEACAAVLCLAYPEAILTCRFRDLPHAIEVTAMAATHDRHPPTTDSPILRLLRMLADSAQCWVTHAEDKRLFHLRITKYRHHPRTVT